MPKTEEEVSALKRDLERFFARHELTPYAWQDGSEVTEEQAAQGAEKTYFRMGFDGDIYRMFWVLDGFGPKEKMRYRSLRRTFDDIVAKHGFWTEFEEYYRICFMSREP